MSDAQAPRSGPTLAVIGGGLAGLAAAVTAAEHGLKVDLFEARRRLGGRAGSFREPESGELVDHCQHVSMGCCTNLADFCRRTGIADGFRRHRRLHFIGPEGNRYDVAAAPLVPVPLHLAPGLLRLGYLGFKHRLRIARTLTRLVRSSAANDQEQTTIGQWLRRQGESPAAIERFWSVILVSALSETLDRASLAAARKVFCEGFLASRRAYELELPRVPLDEIYNRRLGAWLSRHDVAVHLDARVRKIEGGAQRARAVVLSDGLERRFDFFVVAVPWREVRALFAEAMLGSMPDLGNVERIRPAPITAVHLWFDRPITPLPHAILVGRMSQWIFNRAGEKLASETSAWGHYYQVVISASHELAGRNREEVVKQVRSELAAIWPAARDARLLRRQMVTQPEAVFSVTPGLDRFRPAQATPIENVMLAGDWTATGWPASMEGAVRSGYLAAEAVLDAIGKKQRLLVPDLPRSRLARWLIGPGEETRNTHIAACGLGLVTE